MKPWNRSLFDTCSLVTLHKLLLERATLQRHFPKSIGALEESLSPRQMQAAMSKPLRKAVTVVSPPTTPQIKAIFESRTLSPSFASIDTLLFATAVQFQLPVVTSNRPLGRSLDDEGLKVMNVPLILKELVRSKSISKKTCEQLLAGLAKRDCLILGDRSHCWAELETHTFPG